MAGQEFGVLGSDLRVHGFGFQFRGLRLWVKGVGFGMYGLGFRVQDLKCIVFGSEIRVEVHRFLGIGCRIPESASDVPECDQW